MGRGRSPSVQLDDVVALEAHRPAGRDPVKIYGVVGRVRKTRHAGPPASTATSWLIEDGVLPAGVSEAAQVQATPFEPEVFVPPLPGQVVRRASGPKRDQALFFDGMAKRLPAGLHLRRQAALREPRVPRRHPGAHVNISGISGVATKTTSPPSCSTACSTRGRSGPTRSTPRRSSST